MPGDPAPRRKSHGMIATRPLPSRPMSHVIHPARSRQRSRRRLVGHLPGPPHLLRRPQLRRACEGDGLHRPRAAVLLPEAGRCGAAGRRGRDRPDAVSEPDQEPASRGRAGRGDRHRRARHQGRRRDEARLGLRRRPRHDPARPAGRGEEARPAVGHRQGLRPLGADRADPPRRRVQGRRRHRGSRSRSTARSASRARSAS